MLQDQKKQHHAHTASPARDRKPSERPQPRGTAAPPEVQPKRADGFLIALYLFLVLGFGAIGLMAYMAFFG